MISKLISVTTVFFFFVGIFIACSQNTDSTVPVVPDMLSVDENGDGFPDSEERELNRYLWAYTLITYDPGTDEVEVIPVRETAAHWNVLKFLEQGLCTNCVKVISVITNASGNKEFSVEITHPFTNPNLTGFDVRGIAMFSAGHTFSVSGLTTGSGATGELVNAAGYTTLYNSATSGSGPGGLEGYLKGKFASLTIPNSTMNGYRRHMSPGAGNTRNAFYAGDSIAATYEIKMPSSAFVFGYAVDASWTPAITTPVTDPITDFPPDANCLEGWKIAVTQTPIGGGLTDLGGMQFLEIDVYDWQGMPSVTPPVVECLDLFNGTVTAYPMNDFGDYSRWGAEIPNSKLAVPGNYKCLVSVADVEKPMQPAWIDLTARQIVNVQVFSSSTANTGWARTWGGVAEDFGNEVTVDSSGNVYVVGAFADTVDFDPGTPVDNRSSGSISNFDAYLSKYDSNGNYQWASTFGGSSVDFAAGVTTDSAGNIYISGGFRETVDFDPGTGTQNRKSVGMYDIYILKLDSSGNYVWVVTVGGTGNDVSNAISLTPSGDLFIGGYFEGAFNFDPGAGIINVSSNGARDGYVAMFGSVNGNLMTLYTFGGTGYDIVNSVEAGNSNFVYAGGDFESSVDFDPGSLTDLHTSLGYTDAFIAQLNNSSCAWNWTRSFGGSDDDTVRCVVGVSSGRVCAGGYFSNTVDFDPGIGTANKISKGMYDAFLTIFEPDGSLYDALAWGGTIDDEVRGIDINEGGNSIFVTGYYQNSCDFDPGGGSDNHTSKGHTDIYISRFDMNGTWNLTRSFGSSSVENGYDLEIQNTTGNVFLTGFYADTVDFDPTGGIDNHTVVGAVDIFVSKYSSDLNW